MLGYLNKLKKITNLIILSFWLWKFWGYIFLRNLWSLCYIQGDDPKCPRTLTLFQSSYGELGYEILWRNADTKTNFRLVTQTLSHKIYGTTIGTSWPSILEQKNEGHNSYTGDWKS